MRFLSFLTIILLAYTVQSQTMVTTAQKVGTTPAITDLTSIDASARKEKIQARKREAQIPNFIGRGDGPAQYDSSMGLPKGPDPLRAKQIQRKMSGDSVNLDFTLPGLEFNPFVPDPCGEKNKDFYVQVINASTMMVWDEDGLPLLQEPFTVAALWGSLGRQSGGDPIVLYDTETDRWMITEFPPPFSAFLLIAVSQTSDPLGAYDVYEYGTSSFPDYPKWAIWDDAVVVTTNEGALIPTYALNKEQLFGGEDNVTVIRATVPRVGDGPGFQVLTPVDYNGRLAIPELSQPVILRINDDSWGDVEEDLLELFYFDINWNDPNLSTLSGDSIVVTPFDGDFCSLGSQSSLNCVPQPSGSGLDGLAHVVMNQPHYRNFGSHESIVLCHSTDATGDNLAGIRWYELRKTQTQDRWSLYQEGLYAPDERFNRFMPSIAIDRQGNIGLGYSGSSDSLAPSLFVTGRKANDPLGTMTKGENLAFAGTGSIQGSRYGDYASMVVNSDSGKDFWFTSEYGADNGDYSTGIVSFSLINDSIDLAVGDLLAPVLDDDLAANDLTYSIVNEGSDTIASFTYGYVIAGDTVRATYDQPVGPETEIEVTFTDAVPFMSFGDQEIELFVETADDQFLPNNQLTRVASKLPSYDAAVMESGSALINCGATTSFPIVVTNQGWQDITEISLLFSVEGIDSTYEQTFFTTLPYDDAATFIVDASGILLDGLNTVQCTVLIPEEDAITANDVVTIEVEADLDGESILVELDLDDFPQEVSYELFDEGSTVVAAGGPLTGDVLERSFCLEKDSCYSFVIYDSFGDGIFDNPNLTITQSSTDSILVFLQGLVFDDQFVVDFCVGNPCGATLSTVVVDATDGDSNDGTLLVNPGITGNSFTVSIDGGATFTEQATYDSLSAGSYEVIVYDSVLMCSVTETVVINNCNTQLSFNVSDASSATANDGVIAIILDPSLNSSATYTILPDGTPQQQAVFVGLESGAYDIRVTYGNTCVDTLTGIFVGGPSSTANTQIPVYVDVSPNPTDGQSTITIKGISEGFALTYRLYGMNGQTVLSGRLPKYDDYYVGELRTHHLPAGTYLLQVDHPRLPRALKIVKY